MNYYNENDPKAAAWLRELIKAGLIPAGDVDERSITEIKPHELEKYTQCHFFAGIGGWAFALAIAGWPADRPVGTGSCPCQPFSAAGKGLGSDDDRHLWPVFFNLIVECRALGQKWAFTVFGEQVASAEVVGNQLEAAFVDAVQGGDIAEANRLAHELARSPSLHFDQRWLDGIRADLEGADYSLRCEVLGAHSAGSPNIRQRLYWLAYAPSRGGFQERKEATEGEPELGGSCGVDGMGDAFLSGLEGHGRHVDDRDEPGRNGAQAAGSVAEAGEAGGMADAAGRGRGAGSGERASGLGCPVEDGFWDAYDLLPCTDGKARRVEPGTFPLAHGVSGRVGLLRGYGNAINPWVAAEFIKSSLTP